MLKKIAEMLDGREYRNEMTQEIGQLAKDNNIVIVYGASDDLCVFDGAWDDDADCYNDTDIRVTPEGVFQKPVDCAVINVEDCLYLKKSVNDCAVISVIGNFKGQGVNWTYETDIPHETFMIYDDGDEYCRGILFYANDATARKIPDGKKIDVVLNFELPIPDGKNYDIYDFIEQNLLMKLPPDIPYKYELVNPGRANI